MAIAGSIVIDLLMRTGAFESAIRNSSGKLREFGKVAAAASAAAGAALGAATASSVGNANEIVRLSRLANASTTEFQRFAAAAKTLGFEQQDLADILKDVNDKVGDYLITGAGGMIDFFEQVAPKVGLTADAFKKLSGPQALQLYVKAMEDAGASQQEMTFLMEGIASESTRLLPLLLNNSSALNTLADSADRAGTIMDSKTLESAVALKQRTDELKMSMSGASTQIGTALIPELEKLTREFQNPDTLKAAEALANGIVSAFRGIVVAAKEVVGFAQWMGESFAAMTSGVAGDDIIRLEKELEKAEKMLGSWNPADRVRFFGPGGAIEYWSDEELTDEINRLKDAISAAIENQGGVVVIPAELKTPDLPDVQTQFGGPGLGVDLSVQAADAEAASKLEEARLRLLEEGRAVYESTLNPLERYNIEVDRLNGLLREGAIDQETYNRAKAAAYELFQSGKDSLFSGLRTEEEEIRNSYERRKSEILAATEITEIERQDLLSRLQKDFDEQLSELSGKGYWDTWLEDAEITFERFDEIASNAIDSFSSEFADAIEGIIFDSESLNDAFSGMAEGMLRSVVSALAEMAAQWLAYKAVALVVGQTTGASAVSSKIGEAVLSQQMAALNAYSSTAAIPVVGPALAPAAAATALAATSPFVAAVTAAASSSLIPRAIGGPVHSGQSYLVGERGPEMFVPNTSGAILPNSTLGGNGVNINLIENKRKAGTSETRTNANGSQEVDVFIADILGDGPRARAIQRAFGVQRVGY